MQIQRRAIDKITNRVFLEKYLRHIRAKQRDWDIRGGASVPPLLNRSCLLRRKTPPPLPLSATRGAQPLKNYRNYCSPSEEYVYHIRQKAVIEPEFGFVIAEPASVLEKSLPGSEQARSRRGVTFFSGVPDGERFTARQTGEVRTFPTVVSLRNLWEDNYYHFYNDILSRLSLLNECGIDPALPLVVASKLAKQSFFQEAVSCGALAKRNWIVQDDFYIEADNIIFARASDANRNRFDVMLKEMQAPAPDPRKSRKIFLNREAKEGRYLLNNEEVVSVASAHGFEIADASKLSVREQMQLFSETAYLAGAHGAGLINVIFRQGAPMKLLEILPPSPPELTGACYQALAAVFGFPYYFVKGHGATEPKAPRSPFHVDTAKLDKALQQMLRRETA